MTKCKQCDKRGQHETVRCDICLTWMCWDCSSVNDDQYIYVEKSLEIENNILKEQLEDYEPTEEM